jgi:uncharacterized protein YegJ (DUF2314 family)
MNHIKLFEDFADETLGKLDTHNLGLLHKDDAKKRLLEWPLKNKHTKIEKNDWVKIGFTEGKQTEWMWVKISKILKKTDGIADKFEGIVDNEPVVVKNVTLGDKVTIERSQIADLMKAD